MTEESPTDPFSLILMADHDNSWSKYIEAVYTAFRRDFIDSQPKFRGGWVRCRRDPLFDQKEAGFWHCVQEGADEDQRTPDIRRCERVGWIRKLIEMDGNTEIDSWQTGKRGDLRQYLWMDEAYLVVLGSRGNGRWQLITAFCTDRQHTVKKLQKERDECSKNG